MEHIQRVKSEYEGLCSKVDALEQLLSKPKPESISDKQWVFLRKQFTAMRSYQDILILRLIDFGVYMPVCPKGDPRGCSKHCPC
jgi:hypothetical protein